MLAYIVFDCTTLVLALYESIRPLIVSESVHNVHFDQILQTYACQHSLTADMRN